MENLEQLINPVWVGVTLDGCCPVGVEVPLVGIGLEWVGSGQVRVGRVKLGWFSLSQFGSSGFYFHFKILKRVTKVKFFTP